jgi:hypothetical protein
MKADPWNRLDLPLLLQALGDTLTPAHLASVAACLGFALLALTLAHCTAHALRGQVPQSRRPRLSRSLAGVVASLPPAAPALALAGWAGTHGWPVPSLMPTERGDGLADDLWFWLPALLLLSALLTSGLLASPGLRRSGVLAVASAWLLNDALALFPDLATPARAIHADHPLLLAQAFVELALMVALAWTLAALLPGRATTPPSAARRVLEGALLLGHSPWAAWRRHRLPELTRRGLALLTLLLAWAGIAFGNTALLAPLPGLEALHRVGAGFLENPAGVLPPVWPILLCALSLRLAAGMLQRPHRSIPTPAKP